MRAKVDIATSPLLVDQTVRPEVSGEAVMLVSPLADHLSPNWSGENFRMPKFVGASVSPGQAQSQLSFVFNVGLLPSSEGSSRDDGAQERIPDEQSVPSRSVNSSLEGQSSGGTAGQTGAAEKTDRGGSSESPSSTAFATSNEVTSRPEAKAGVSKTVDASGEGASRTLEGQSSGAHTGSVGAVKKTNSDDSPSGSGSSAAVAPLARSAAHSPTLPPAPTTMSLLAGYARLVVDKFRTWNLEAAAANLARLNLDPDRVSPGKRYDTIVNDYQRATSSAPRVSAPLETNFERIVRRGQEEVAEKIRDAQRRFSGIRTAADRPGLSFKDFTGTRARETVLSLDPSERSAFWSCYEHLAKTVTEVAAIQKNNDALAKTYSDAVKSTLVPAITRCMKKDAGAEFETAAIIVCAAFSSWITRSGISPSEIRLAAEKAVGFIKRLDSKAGSRDRKAFSESYYTIQRSLSLAEDQDLYGSIEEIRQSATNVDDNKETLVDAFSVLADAMWDDPTQSAGLEHARQFIEYVGEHHEADSNHALPTPNSFWTRALNVGAAWLDSLKRLFRPTSEAGTSESSI